MSLFMDIKKDPKKISISELLSFIEDNFIKNNHVTIFLIMLKKNSNLNRAVPRCVVREYFL